MKVSPALCRLAGLTYLRLKMGHVSQGLRFSSHREDWRLAELEITGTNCSEKFLTSFLIRLPHLTSLTIEHCGLSIESQKYDVLWRLLPNLR